MSFYKKYNLPKPRFGSVSQVSDYASGHLLLESEKREIANSQNPLSTKWKRFARPTPVVEVSSDDDDDDDYYTSDSDSDCDDDDYVVKSQEEIQATIQKGAEIFGKFLVSDDNIRDDIVNALDPQQSIDESFFNLEESVFPDEIHFCQEEAQQIFLDDKDLYLASLDNKIAQALKSSEIFDSSFKKQKSKFEAAYQRFLKSKFSIDDALVIINFKNLDKSQIPDSDLNEFERILNFSDKDYVLMGKDANFKIVYITSGGGKSTLNRDYAYFKFRIKDDYYSFYDVDDFIKDNYDSYQKFKEFSSKLNVPNIMMRWFKYQLSKNVKNLQYKILLFNNPNQFPGAFRMGFNELVICPKKFKFGLRFFNENFFSNLAVRGKYLAFLNYVEYADFIMKFFGVSKLVRDKFRLIVPDNHKRKNVFVSDSDKPFRIIKI